MEEVALPRQVSEAIIAHARFCDPEEACGLLAANGDGAIRMVYATTNVDHSKVRFTVAPHEHFGAIRHAEHHGWSITGSFHSHPQSSAFPSSRDIAGALDPTWLYLIVGMGEGEPELRGFRIRDSLISEVALSETP